MHFFLDFGDILLGAGTDLLTVFLKFVAVGLLNVLDKLGAISDHCALECVDDRATSLIKTVRAADLEPTVGDNG